MLVSCLIYYSALKMEPTCSSETLVVSQRTTRRYISEEKALHLFCGSVREHLYVLSGLLGLRLLQSVDNGMQISENCPSMTFGFTLYPYYSL
jgi:hypothetical protein